MDFDIYPRQLILFYSLVLLCFYFSLFSVRHFPFIINSLRTPSQSISKPLSHSSWFEKFVLSADLTFTPWHPTCLLRDEFHWRACATSRCPCPLWRLLERNVWIKRRQLFTLVPSRARSRRSLIQRRKNREQTTTLTGRRTQTTLTPRWRVLTTNRDIRSWKSLCTMASFSMACTLRQRCWNISRPSHSRKTTSWLRPTPSQVSRSRLVLFCPSVLASSGA